MNTCNEFKFRFARGGEAKAFRGCIGARADRDLTLLQSLNHLWVSRILRHSELC